MTTSESTTSESLDDDRTQRLLSSGVNSAGEVIGAAADRVTSRPTCRALMMMCLAGPIGFVAGVVTKR